MIKNNYLLIFLTFFLNFTLKAFDPEYIISFDSIINVQKDSSLIIEETIEVLSSGRNIKRGIFRDFPTIYQNFNKHVIDFDVIEIKRNDSPEQYSVKNLKNGKRIYIGDKNYYLHPGIHTYSIKYRTNRQIGFFKNSDELFWNVTGNGWQFSIDKATAIVNLPQEIPPSQIKYDFYTGYSGSKAKNANARLEKNNKIIFETTRPLKPNQGLTIVVGWPKGFIKEPSFWQNAYYILRDNIVIIWIIFSIILILFYYIYIYLKLKNPLKRTIIPIFEPPDNLSPAQLGYIEKMKYSGKLFTAEILYMAVKGYLKIEYKNSTYTLIKDKEPEPNSHYHKIWTCLFANTDNLTLNKSNEKIVDKAIDRLKFNLDINLQKKYFASFDQYLTFGIITSILMIIPIFFMNENYIFIAIILLAIINIIFSRLLKQYTNEGNDIIAQIRGFKMFLSATEKERVNFFAAPDRTPENFEVYLPYAVVFGLEKKWTAQFKSVFEKLKEQNIQYIPNWYLANSFNIMNASNISSGINSYVYDTISSSQIRPGSSSGFGSSSSGSGGGGGGGGGGGW